MVSSIATEFSTIAAGISTSGSSTLVPTSAETAVSVAVTSVVATWLISPISPEGTFFFKLWKSLALLDLEIYTITGLLEPLEILNEIVERI